MSKSLMMFIFSLLMERIYCKTSISSYPTVDLVENSDLYTLVVSLSSLMESLNASKLVLLNLNGYETNLFSIINESIYTIHFIDREEFIDKGYCLDDFYCKIEIHILVNDGYGYWIIPIHIVDENDNEGKFREKEIELEFRENIVNGYQIPFEGAKDIDEGKNSEITYYLEYSNEKLNLLFELIILSQSSSKYDRLALKFHPSSSIEILNEYKLKLYAMDKTTKKKGNVLNLNIRIEQKEKLIRFSLSEYEFVVLLNSSFERKENIPIKIGRVSALPNSSFERIYYQLILNLQNEIQINSLTGELVFNQNFNFLKKKEAIKFHVQASILKRNSSKMLIIKSEVKVFIRYLNELKNILFNYQINLTKSNEILQINSSNSFFIDQNIQIHQNLVFISIYSTFYPSDQFSLSLNNYLHLFSLLSSSNNTFTLQIKQNLHSTSIYLLNIGVKHQLTQQWLPNLNIELIVIDQWTTTTVNTVKKILTNQNQSIEFCQKDQKYILYQRTTNEKKKKKRIGLFQVIQSNSIKTRKYFFGSLNGSEIIIDGCRMSFDQMKLFNQSFNYEICLFSSLNICYNLTIKDHQLMEKRTEAFLSIKLIELIMFILSLLFSFITIILILFICQLKDFNLCLKIKNYFIYRIRFNRTNVQQQFSTPSSSKIQKRVDSLISEESCSPSFQSIRRKNDQFIDDDDDSREEEEALPSTNIFILSSSSPIDSLPHQSLTIPPRPCSSSSFLQETKQLLDLISNHQHLDLPKLVSEV